MSILPQLGFNVLDVSEFKHYRINHSKRFVKKHKHINGIENFWNQAEAAFTKVQLSAPAALQFVLEGM